MIFFIIMIMSGVIFYYFTGSFLVVGVAVGSIFLIILWGGQIQLVHSKEEVDQAVGNIDDSLQKRHDQLVKIVDSVKNELKRRDEQRDKILALAEDQKTVPKGLISLKIREDYEKWYQQTRQQAMTHLGKQGELDQNSHRLLIQSISEVEDNLSAARRFYNHSVSKYNGYLGTFPGNLIGKHKKLSPYNYYQVTDEKVREDVKILF